MKGSKKQYIAAILIGVFSGILTIYIVPSQFEIFIWLLLIVAIGLIGHTFYPRNLFLKTFAFAILVSVAITGTHILFVKDYLLVHQDETEMLNKISILHSERLTLLVIAPVYWLVLGLLAGFAGKLIRRLIS